MPNSDGPGTALPAAPHGCRTWMPGAKPPSSPTFTESTPYLKAGLNDEGEDVD